MSGVRKWSLVPMLLSVLVAGASAKKPALDTPTVRCDPGATYIDVTVQAGASGASAGFELQWMSRADFEAQGWSGTVNEDGTVTRSDCMASFSGNARGSRYRLGPDQAVTVRIGDLLLDKGVSSSCLESLAPCTEFVFRVVAQPTRDATRSAFSDVITGKTAGCSDCAAGVKSVAYWSLHPLEWPVPSMWLGDRVYSQAELLAILSQPADDNGLVTLAQQLIAVKLAIYNGAALDVIALVIGETEEADLLIGPLVVPPVGAGYLAPAETDALTGPLESWVTAFACE